MELSRQTSSGGMAGRRVAKEVIVVVVISFASREMRLARG